jgi:hypothetical protein
MLMISTLCAISITYADVNIEQILPDNSIAVISVNDVSVLADHLQKTGLCDSICEMGQDFSEHIPEKACPLGSSECAAIIESLELDETKFKFPTGSAGAGIYPVLDHESGTVGIGLIAMMQVEGTPYADLFDKITSNFEDNLEVVDLSGREVLLLTGYMPTNLPNTGPFDLSSFSQVYLANTDGYLIIGSEPDCIARAFSAIDGEPEANSLSNEKVFTSLMEQCGGDGDIHAAVLLENFADVIVQLDPTGQSMMFLPMLKSFFGDIDGLAESVTFAPSDDVMLKGKYALYMADGRSGLLGLIGENTSENQVPIFVGDDILSYSQTNIDFSKVSQLVKEILTSNPMLAYQFGPQGFEQMEQSVQLAVAPLGSELHFLSTGRLPFSDDSLGYLVAVECTDEEQLSNFLNTTLPMMGSTSSDFLGNQIYTIDMSGSMMMPLPIEMSMSIAVGGGYAFCGLTHSVEDALRAVANPKENSSTNRKNSACQLLKNNDISGWGYGDMKKSIDIQQVVSEKMQEKFLEEIEAFDPEMASEMRAEFAQSQTMQNMFLESLSMFLGPMAWNMSTSETGFTSEVIMMKGK